MRRFCDGYATSSLQTHTAEVQALPQFTAISPDTSTVIALPQEAEWQRTRSRWRAMRPSDGAEYFAHSKGVAHSLFRQRVADKRLAFLNGLAEQ